MKTIKTNEKNELIIKSSKFITYSYYIDSKDIVTNILNKLKDEYKDATHICYAYIINNTKKYSDDKEPSNTAGLPILNILEKNNLTNVLVVTIRYFGGIKLGANGLIRAYSTSAKEVINKSEIVTLIEGINIEINFKLDKTRLIDNLLKDYSIKKEYHNTVKYDLILPLDIYNKIKDILALNSISLIEKGSILIK